MTYEATMEVLMGGMRRHWPGSPCCLPLGRDPGFVREVLLRGGERVVEAASRIGSWVHLMALAEAGWLGHARASERMSLAETGERLCRVARAARPIDSLLGCAVGEVALVTGIVAAAPKTGPAAGPLWAYTRAEYPYDEFFAAEDPWPLSDEPMYVETAHDFIVSEAHGRTATAVGSVLVQVYGAYLVGAKRLEAGDRVGVLGFVDETIDGDGRRRFPRGQPVSPVLRTGPSLPLLVLHFGAAQRPGYEPQRTVRVRPSYR